MWRKVGDLLGYDSSDDDFTGTCVDDANVLLFSKKETVEIFGVVTDIFEDYGLINHNILFTKETYNGFCMPKKGEEVITLATRTNQNKMWKADRVYKAHNCGEDDETGSDDDGEESWVDESEKNEKRKEFVRRLQEMKLKERLETEALLSEKLGIKVEGGDFGKVSLGENKPLKIVLRLVFFNVN